MARKSAAPQGEQRSPKRGLKKSSVRKRAPVNGRAEADIVKDRPPSSLRGFLPTPPEVERLVDQGLQGRPASAAARQRITDDFKMQYYFGGHPVAFRRTDRGIEVLAVGMDAIGRLKGKRMTDAERESIITGWWDPWPW